MPTGYNYKVIEHKQPFSEFLWDCVRGIDVFIHMKEDPSDAKLRFPEPSAGGAKNNVEARVLRESALLDEERAELDAELAKTPEQVEAEYEAHKTKCLRDYKERIAQAKPIHEHVTRVRSEVADWQPPSPDHEGLKMFMLEQLDIALAHEAELPPKPEFPKTASVWHSDHVRWLQDYVDRLENDLREIVEAANAPDAWQGDRAWIESLIASVPPPPGRFEDR